MSDAAYRLLSTALIFDSGIEIEKLVNQENFPINDYINNTQTNNRETPLMLAIAMGKTTLAAAIIIKGADINYADELGLIPLMHAINAGDKKIVELLIGKGANVNFKNKDGFTPLMYAVDAGDEKIVEMLITNGSDVDTACDGITPLIHALQVGNIVIAELLIKYRADVNCKNKNDLTPLMYAIIAGDKKIAKLLIDNGANVSPTTKDGDITLSLAVEKGNIEIVELLINSDAKVDAICYNRRTPLSIVAVNGDIKIAKLLIKNGADVNFKGEADITPLIAAATYSKIQIVELLISNHADVNFKCKTGQTALMCAARVDALDIVKLLINNGAIISSANEMKGLKENVLLQIAEFFEQHAKQGNNSEQQLRATASAIIVRNEIYNRAVGDKVLFVEANAHDTSFAYKALSVVKAQLENKKQRAVPTFEEAISQIREMLTKRILNSDASDSVKNNLGTDPKSRKDFLSSYNRVDQDQLAFLWITSFQDTMPFPNDERQKAAMLDIEKMLPYIVACRNATMKNNEPTSQSKDMDYSIICNLSNLMQSNEGMMSCAQGTPRGFRSIFETFISIYAPQESQHENVKYCASVVINNIMRNNFKKIDTKLSQTPDKLKKHITHMCEALATLGFDNADKILNGEALYGATSGEQYEAKHLSLRNIVMTQAYPTYEDFETAVVGNMKTQPSQQITLSDQDTAYLHLQYIAIANQETRDLLLESLGAELIRISKEIAMTDIPSNIINAITKFKKDNKRPNFKNTLANVLRLTVGETFDLDKGNTATEAFLKDVQDLTTEPTPVEGKNLLEKLKKHYDDPVESSQRKTKPQ